MLVFFPLCLTVNKALLKHISVQKLIKVNYRTAKVTTEVVTGIDLGPKPATR